jgi:membrane protease YdiL (CAAX protease family)
MSSESNALKSERSERALKTGLVLIAILLVSLLSAAAVSAWLYVRLEGADSVFGHWVRSEPHRFMRRLMSLIALAGVPLLLKVGGWRGWRDCGVLEDNYGWESGRVLRDFSEGLLIGLCTLTPLIALSYIFELRSWSPQGSAGVIALGLGLVVVRALLVGVSEEIVARGVLFRVFNRVWTLWPAVFVSSALFAYLHFFKASPDAFSDHVSLISVFDIIGSAFRNVGLIEQVEIRFINLTLMSMVLCMMVAYTGTIWLAAGTHAGWVCIKLSNRMLTRDTRGEWDAHWIGHRSDATDGLLTSCLLLFLLIVWWRRVRLRNSGIDA